MSAGEAHPVYVVYYPPGLPVLAVCGNGTNTAMPFDTANQAAAYNKMAG